MNRSHQSADDDDRLIARLAAYAGDVDPPPRQLYELGYATYELYRIDDELAELVADSRLDQLAVRAGTGDVRLLSFECRGTTVEIQISGSGRTRSVLGQLLRPEVQGAGRALLQLPSGPTVSTSLDAYDRFEFVDVPQTLVRIKIEPAGAPSVTTAWVEL